MTNIVNELSNLGKYEEAEQMHRQTFELHKHPSALTSISNLGVVLSSALESEEIHRQTLQAREMALGKEHPSTLTSMNNIAVVLKNLGKYQEAKQIH